MPGRGRPPKADSLDAKSKTTQRVQDASLPRSPELSEEKPNEATKELKPKKKETKKLSVEIDSKGETTNPSTEERTTTENTKATGRGAKAKTPAARTVSAGARTSIQPDIPKETETGSPDTKRTGNTSNGRAKPLDDPEITTKPKKSGRKAEAAIKEETPSDKEALTSVLNRTLNTLKIRRKDTSSAAKVTNEIIGKIVRHLKDKSQSFKDVEDPLPTGSYYEKLKISSPDEFDFMIPVPVDRVNVEPFGDDGAYYTVGLKRGNSSLKKFQEGETLSASEMLHEFREEVKKCVKEFKEWELTRKKAGCPAVTLTTTVASITISLDVVLCIMVKSSWPPFTTDGLKVETWLGAKEKQAHRRKPYYLVPKYEGRGTKEKDGVPAKAAWRVSFSHIEKAIMRSHGSEKTCCEKGRVQCCRKACLKLLKHLLGLLKESNSKLDKFCSYHAKTTLLHACCSRPKDIEWKASDLCDCFRKLLDDFVGHLENAQLSNFFIPSQNLLSGPSKKMCKTLAELIREERCQGFPILKQYLNNWTPGV